MAPAERWANRDDLAARRGAVRRRRLHAAVGGGVGRLKSYFALIRSNAEESGIVPSRGVTTPAGVTART